MTREQLAAEVALETNALGRIVAELSAIAHEAEAEDPDFRTVIAAGALLQQFYNGVENILKRLSHFLGQPLPEGDRFHITLLDRFTVPTQPPYPPLLDADLAADLDHYRQFRHVFRQIYSFDLQWSRFQQGVVEAEGVFDRFAARVQATLEAFPS